jgi:hypothetical protein
MRRALLVWSLCAALLVSAGADAAGLPFSLSLGAATSDRVTIAPSTANSGLTARTVVLLVRPTTLTTNRTLWARLPGGTFNGFLRMSDTAGNVQWAHRRTANTFDYGTNSAPLVLTQWRWIAATYDLSLGASVAHVYSASLTGAWAEATYSTSTQGSGTCDQSDATDNEAIGNFSTGSPTVAFQGDMAYFGEWNRALGLDELQSIKRGVRPQRGWIADLVLAANGGGQAIDRSGVGSNGTLTGAIPTNRNVPIVTLLRPRSRL